MSDRRESEDVLRLTHIPTSPVGAFLRRAGFYEAPEHIPLLEEWCAWAGRFPTVGAAWDACRDPELLLFMHLWAGHTEEEIDDVLFALDRITCVWAAEAGVDPRTLVAFEDRELSVFKNSFGLESPTHWGVARAMMVEARSARVAMGEDPDLVRSEQMHLLRAHLPNPFRGYVGVTHLEFYRAVE